MGDLLMGYTGEQGRLSIVVRQSTAKVKCFKAMGKPPVYWGCLQSLGRMPVSEDVRTFGERGVAGIDVALPLRYSDRIRTSQ